MKLRWIILITLVSALLGAVWFAPAATLYGWFAPANMAVTLSGIDGTVTRGRVQAVSQGDRIYVAPLSWQFRPLRLLTGQAAWRLEFGGPTSGSADLRASVFGRLRLRNARLVGDAAPLLEAAGYRGLPIRGTLGVDLRRLDLGSDGRLRAAEGDAQVIGLAWALGANPIALGDFSAELRPRPDGSHRIEIRSADDAPLDVTGEVQLATDNSYDVHLRLRARQGAEPQAANLLGLIGRPDNQGVYHIRQRGRLQ